jgi:Hydroxymethylglutaryl-coenzyme A synthase C terminal
VDCRRAARRSSLDVSRPCADATGQAAKISLDGTESLYHSKVPGCVDTMNASGICLLWQPKWARLAVVWARGFDTVLNHMQVASAAELPRQTGNMYTASLWAGLASLISELGDELLACQVTASALRRRHSHSACTG